MRSTLKAQKIPAEIRAGHTRPRPFSNLFYVAASRPAQMTTDRLFSYDAGRGRVKVSHHSGA
jgi:hypothetical protein